MSNPNVTITENEIVTSRLLDAPPELVFDAWTNPAHLAHWYGPDGFTLTTKEIDVKKGGSWNFIMHGPDGRDYINKVIFIEVEKPHRLVSTHAGGGDTADISFQTTITFEKLGNQTLLTMRSVFKSAAALEKVIQEHGAVEGGKQTLNRLAEYLIQMK